MKHILLAASAAVLLAACGAMEKKEPPPKPFVGTRWQVLLESPPAGQIPWVRFGDGRVQGFGGCNPFSAPIIQDSVGAKAIAIQRIEIEPRGVCDASIVAVQRRMLEVLQSVSSYTIAADVLKMSGSAGTLTFHALPQ